MDSRWRKVLVGTVVAVCAIAVLPVTAFAVKRGGKLPAAPVPEFAKSRQLVADIYAEGVAAVWSVPSRDGGTCRFLTFSVGPTAARPTAAANGGGYCLLGAPAAVERIPPASLTVRVSWRDRSKGGFDVIVSGIAGESVASVAVVSGGSKRPVMLRNGAYIAQLSPVETIGHIADSATTRLAGFDADENEVDSIRLDEVLRAGGWTS